MASRAPFRPGSAFVIAALLLAAGIPAEARKEKPFRIAGVAEDEKGKPVPVDVLSATTSGVRVSITYLDPADASKALGTVVDTGTSIFRARSETSRGHLVFAVEIENRGPSDIFYQPGQGRLITDRADAEFPMDYTMLYGLLERLPGEAPSLEELEKAIYSRSMAIRSGGSVRKLLVFEGPRNGRFKKLEVRVGSMQMADGEVDPRFHFRKFEVEP